MGEKGPLKIDRKALRRALEGPEVAEPEGDWCVACGASHGAAPEFPVVLQQELSKDPSMLKALLEPEFVRGLAERLGEANENADWCVACGASHSKAPELERVQPATRASLSDAEIDRIAARLIEAAAEEE